MASTSTTIWTDPPVARVNNSSKELELGIRPGLYTYVGPGIGIGIGIGPGIGLGIGLGLGIGPGIGLGIGLEDLD